MDHSGRSFDLTYYDWDLSALTEIRHRVGGATQTVRKTDPGVRECFKGMATVLVPVQPLPARTTQRAFFYKEAA